MRQIAYINVEKRTLEFAEPIKWHTPTVANLDRIPLFTKEALAQTQEPVATVEAVATVVSESGNQEVTMSWWHEPALPVGTKLYTTPPQRTWQGLTDEEIDVIDEATWDEDHKSWGIHDFARAIEAKLKEKNNG